MSLRYYIASRWARGPDLCESVVRALVPHECAHRWWLVPETPKRYEGEDAPPHYTETEWAGIADTDLNAILCSDVVIVIAPTGRDGLGMWTELGYALAKGKPVILCAPQEHRALVSPASPWTSPFFYGQAVRRVVYENEAQLAAFLADVMTSYAHALGEAPP